MPSWLQVKSSLGALMLCVLVLAPASQAIGQKQAKQLDVSALRRAFDGACAAEFELVRSELARNDSQHTGARYWLAHVRPRRSGVFTVQYKYKHSDPMFTHGVRALSFTVGPRGCPRLPQYFHTATYGCLGDTFILPVSVDEYTGHAFSLRKETYDPMLWETAAAQPSGADEDLDTSAVVNPAAEYVQYVGRQLYDMPHRSRSGNTREFSATFIARKPGRFNLALGSTTPGAAATEPSLAGSVPVLIIAPGEPLAMVVQHEEVDEYDGDPPRFAVHGGSGGYRTNLIVVQPGDRFSLRYAASIYQRSYDRAEPPPQATLNEVVPVIEQLPFMLDPTFAFNAWLAGYLPVAPPRPKR